MNVRVRTALKLLLIAAAVVAARPYLEFLVGPPAHQAGRWLATVAALGIIASVGLLLYRTRSARR